jgi:hypothetical protein
MENDTRPRFNGGDEASSYLLEKHGVRVASKTLDKWRCIGGGPSFRRFGRKIVYDRQALDEWAALKLGGALRSTSDTGAEAA